MYEKSPTIRAEDLPFDPSILSIGNSEIKYIYLESPGVYRLCMASAQPSLPSPELLVVTEDASAISAQARSYGEMPFERPDLTVFRCNQARGGREIVEFEICRCLTKQGAALPEGYSLRDMAYSAMELYPEYFGALPAPMHTPWGYMVRHYELASGVFWLETDQCKELLAVASPVWEVDLTETARKLGKMVGRDKMGYLFFPKRASCVPLFELLPLHREWKIHGIIDKAALMNALLKYQSRYAAEHNEREYRIAETIRSSKESQLGILDKQKLVSKDLIYPTEGAGTDFCLFLSKWGRNGIVPKSEPDLSLLTEKQRAAYSLRMQGLSYKQIAEKLGITASGVTQNIQHAERRLREYERYQRMCRKDQKPVAFPLTRADLLLIENGLGLLEQELRKSTARRADTDWKGRLLYQSQLIEALRKRMRAVLFGLEEN